MKRLLVGSALSLLLLAPVSTAFAGDIEDGGTPVEYNYSPEPFSTGEPDPGPQAPEPTPVAYDVNQANWTP